MFPVFPAGGPSFSHRFLTIGKDPPAPLTGLNRKEVRKAGLSLSSASRLSSQTSRAAIFPSRLRRRYVVDRVSTSTGFSRARTVTIGTSFSFKSLSGKSDANTGGEETSTLCRISLPCSLRKTILLPDATRTRDRRNRRQSNVSNREKRRDVVRSFRGDFNVQTHPGTVSDSQKIPIRLFLSSPSSSCSQGNGCSKHRWSGCLGRDPV